MTETKFRAGGKSSRDFWGRQRQLQELLREVLQEVLEQEMTEVIGLKNEKEVPGD